MAAELPPRDMPKAQQPISATLEVLGEQLPGARVTLALTAKTQIPADNVELRLDVPQALVLTAGEPSWKGSLQKGGQASLRVDVMIPDAARYEIRGAAIATCPHDSSDQEPDSAFRRFSRRPFPAAAAPERP